jgi:hypothetical protein
LSEIVPVELLAVKIFVHDLRPGCACNRSGLICRLYRSPFESSSHAVGVACEPGSARVPHYAGIDHPLYLSAPSCGCHLSPMAEDFGVPKSNL